MIIAYQASDTSRPQEIDSSNLELLHHALWIDLINPTFEEEQQVERILHLDVPTREEMREIELSSRLYKENDTLFMTGTMIAQSDTVSPKQDAVTFVLTKKQLITIRYIEPQAFRLFTALVKRSVVQDPAQLLIELLEITVDRLADILELISHHLETYSKTIFQQQGSEKPSYQQLMQQLGVNGELNAKIVESLVSFNRLIAFFAQSASVDQEGAQRVATLGKDINALNDHANFLSNKISFLLDATLGMVHIEQNAIIKIFSVAAVIFLPPTLIASIYGMNFNVMPELSWKYGYPLAFGLMLLSSWLPYKYFKYRKWL